MTGTLFAIDIVKAWSTHIEDNHKSQETCSLLERCRKQHIVRRSWKVVQMHCNIEFFSIHNAANSQLSTVLPKQQIAFISGISQPCNSSSGLHAPFTTCRMSCTRRRYKGQKTGMTSKKCYVFASKCVPCFSCVCMCWCDGYSHKCDILSWRQQQVTASVC